MTVTGGTVVALSASINAPKLGGAAYDENGDTSQEPFATPMLLQVSMVTTMPRDMTYDEFKNALEAIKLSKDFIDKSFKQAKDFYKANKDIFEGIDAGMKAMEGLGKIIGGIVNLFPDPEKKEKENPVVKNLAELENDVKQLGEKLNEHFDEMKAFISEQSFFTRIVNPTTVLTKHMRDCIKYPGDRTKENFKKAYYENFPLKLQYILVSYLEHRTTNPLKMSMDMEKVKTAATFNKWEDIICRIMLKFAALEAFAKGLLGLESNTNMKRHIDSSMDTFTDMDNWRAKYTGGNQAYWKEFEAYLVPFIESHTHLNNSQKADEIKAKLDTYLTDDSFYIFVFNETKWLTDYFYFCSIEKDQLIGSWRKGGCNAFVYRSKTGGKKDSWAYGLLQGQLEFLSKAWKWERDLQYVLDNDMIVQLEHAYGFYCLMNPVCCPEIRHLTDGNPIHGPGQIFEYKDVKLIVSFL